jgi:hypothetical protein
MTSKWLKIVLLLFSNFIIWIVSIFVGYSIAIVCSLMSLIYLFYFLEKEKKLSTGQKIISTATYLVPKIVGLICLALILIAWTWLSLVGCSSSVCASKNYFALVIEWFLFFSFSVASLSKEAFLKGYLPLLRIILIVTFPATFIYFLYVLFLNSFK